MLLKYKCNLCDNQIEKLVQRLDEARGAVPCQCGGWLERQLSAPSSNAVESVDDGITIKPVHFDRERYNMARQQGDDILREQKKKLGEES